MNRISALGWKDRRIDYVNIDGKVAFVLVLLQGKEEGSKNEGRSKNPELRSNSSAVTQAAGSKKHLGRFKRTQRQDNKEERRKKESSRNNKEGIGKNAGATRYILEIFDILDILDILFPAASKSLMPAILAHHRQTALALYGCTAVHYIWR